MKFPNKKFKNLREFLIAYKSEASKMFNENHVKKLEKIANILSKIYKSQKTLYVCGNGGSASIAEHFVCDHQKLLATTKKFLPKVISLSSNLPLITAIANDTDYSNIFSDQLRYNYKPGDMLFVISASGNSPNIVNALKVGNEIGMKTFAILGYTGGDCKKLAQHPIHISVNDMQISEDLQLIVGHMCMQWLLNNPVEIKK